MDSRRTVSPESALASDIFDKFCSANTLKAILTHYRHLCKIVRLKPTHFPDFYPRLKAKLSSWRAQGLWSKFEKRASHKCYARGKACYGTRVLIIGAGPCGLRTAIEAQLLGAKVVIIEKRDRFSRNNVLHLWPFVITDLKALGAKKFYGKFCAGSIDHISIRQIQCILLKVALLLGVEVHEGVGFEGLHEPTETEGWRAMVLPVDHPVSHYSFDALIGADGRRNTLTFKRKALRAKLAIAITANFLNKHTEAEARVKEISGVSYIFNQKFFQELNEATGIDLENIVYYKDETHYFVMTAKKQSLLNKGVLLQDHADTAKLLSGENISSDALMTYALEAAIFSTDSQLPDLDFAVNHYGKPDVAMFDFTAMYAAENACRVVQRKGHKLLMSLVGDSLLEPFWPTGSGCARGFLSSFDTCWMLRSWSMGKSILEVLAERESIYRLLGQTTPENLNKEHLGYTIDPHSRYPNLNLRVVMPYQVSSLFDTDEVVAGADLVDSQDEEQLLIEAEKVSKKRRRDSVIAVDALLSWYREQVMGYGLDIQDICDAFLRGDVLCAIINRFRPDLIEFPLPISSEENVDPLDIAACRNQIAFDLLHEEHGLPPVMSGFESVQCTSSDFLTIVAYLSQIYEVFRGEIPQIKYPRVDSGEELEEYEQRSSHCRQHSSRPALVVKHTAGKSISRRNRVSSSGRSDSRVDGESESSRKHKKRRSDDRSRGSVGRDIKSLSNTQPDPEFGKQHVPGLAKNLEEKLKGSKLEKKPKDLIRAIGKIEKSDWNVQLIEKKIAESKTHCQSKNRDKVPKWSREAFDDKREAMKRKMDGGVTDKSNDKLQLFEDTVKKLGSKLKEGNTLEVGQRGSNKVSQMAEQLVNKCREPKEETVVVKPSVQRPVFEPKTAGLETCHFCNERVYVVEKMTAVPVPMHRACFRCEYCNTSLRLGNYVFDREGRYGDRFYCTPHWSLIRVYGWKKYDQEIGSLQEGNKSNLLVSPSQQILSEMNALPLSLRGKTPERIEFENSVNLDMDQEFALLSEDEWTDRNFGVSNADNNTSDEASDLSDDEDITPEGNDHDLNGCPPGLTFSERMKQLANKGTENSDSDDTELASGEEQEDDEDASGEEDEDYEEQEGDADEEEDDDDDEEDEDCGSTTEIETDSEFAEDPPHSVPPGNIPQIIVDEPEQVVTRIIEPAPLSHTQSPQKVKQSHSKGHHHHQSRHYHQQQQQSKPPQLEEEQFVDMVDVLQHRMIEPVKKNIPERVLPRVNPVPKKWQPLPEDHNMTSKLSLELKQRYLHGADIGGLRNQRIGIKNTVDSTAQNQFRSVLDMISEQQKLLQPAAKPSATMQAFLDGAEKLKQKQSLSPLGCGMKYSSVIGVFNAESPSPLNSRVCPWSVNELEGSNSEAPAAKSQDENGGDNLRNMNRLNLEKTMEIDTSDKEDKEKGDFEKVIDSRFVETPVQPQTDVIVNCKGKDTISVNHVHSEMKSEPPSVSQSETDTQNTIVDTIEQFCEKTKVEEGDKQIQDDDEENEGCESNQDSDTDSESDDLDEEEDDENVHILREPPRSIKIEDEFGVTVIDEDFHPKSSETFQNLEMNREERSVCGGNEDEGDAAVKSGGGMSSSDSKDSLNSGMFLDTELSDFQTRDVDDMDLGLKKKSIKSKVFDGSNKHMIITPLQYDKSELGDKYTKLKASLTLDLAGLDFMDGGINSSPEEILIVAPKKQGYCKLANEEIDSDSDLNAVLSTNWNVPVEDVDGDDEHFSDGNTSSRNSTPTLGCAQESTDKNTPLINSSSIDTVVETVNPMVETVLLQSVPQKNLASSSQEKNKDNFVILDRVVPFSSARDSLDYRKMKNVSSPLKSKDLFSSYNQNLISPTSNPTSRSTIEQQKISSLRELGVDEVQPQSISDGEVITTLGNVQEDQDERENILVTSTSTLGVESSNPEDTQSSSSLKSSSSPRSTAKRIAEINKERVKQSDLIRSMVMGKIVDRKSTKKNRRGSRGSLSPFPSSSSGSSEHFLKSEYQEAEVDTENDSHLSSQHSIQTSSNADTTEADESQLNTNSIEYFVEEVNSSDDVSQTSSSSYSNGHSSRHTNEKSASRINSHYEPVFTSSFSPRFRNRPRFENPFSIYNSVTNPPTPVNPKDPLFSPVTPDLTTPSSTPPDTHQDELSQQQNRNKSPSFYRSMPDLTAFLTPASYGKVGKWEVCKSTTGFADREKARLAARERARLKSDHELGLESHYIDKLRRKISVPEDDIFDPNAAVIVTTTKRSGVGGGSKNRPLSDIFDNVASSIRHNVDFPIAKTNPFVVSPTSAPGLSSQFVTSVPANSSSTKKDATTSNVHKTNEERQQQQSHQGDTETDDFVHLQLRINPKNHATERKKSPEKARSTGWDSHQVPDLSNFPNYFTTVSSPSQPPSFASTKSDPTWLTNKLDGSTRSRSNTFSDSNVEQNFGNNSIGSNVFTRTNTDTVTAALLPCTTNTASLTSKPLQCKSKKALSSDALLIDDSTLTSPSGNEVPSASLPDITDVIACSPERKTKKPKDRERRKSIIQAVSDFFRSNNGSPSSSSTSNNAVELEKSNSNGSPPIKGPSDKFSLFKLTPKLLHKDKRANSKSRETLSPGLSDRHIDASLTPKSSKSSSFISYLSQPDMIIQRLASSPTPFKSSRLNLNSSPRYESSESSPHSLPHNRENTTTNNEHYSDASRIKEINEISLQLESIENEQRQLECRGVSIEKKLKGEEKDENNREDTELMEEWFTLVREKTRLSRFARELTVRVQQLKLEERQSQIQEQLDLSMNLSDVQKTPDHKALEVDLVNELHALENQKGNLLSKFHEDILKYESEDAELESKIASSSFTPLESNV